MYFFNQNNMKSTILTCIIGAMLVASCSTPRFAVKKAYQKLSAEEKDMADTLIMKALNNEGLYTVLGRLKSMSSVTDLRLSIAQKDTSFEGIANVTDLNSPDLIKLKKYQRVVNALNFGDLKFILSPLKINQNGQRYIQINLYRKSLVDSLINVNQSFYGQFGFVSGTQAEILINTTEYENKYDRFRSYGYLFGYPEHAVNFFVDASISNDKTGVFVKRNFFQIPVHSNIKGHFVYAIPLDSKPGPIDSAIYKRAEHSLNIYRSLRKEYMKSDSSFKAFALLNKLLKTNER
jgi:hypothetical protein